MSSGYEYYKNKTIKEKIKNKKGEMSGKVGGAKNGNLTNWIDEIVN